jgi:hypothetical protein
MDEHLTCRKDHIHQNGKCVKVVGRIISPHEFDRLGAVSKTPEWKAMSKREKLDKLFYDGVRSGEIKPQEVFGNILSGKYDKKVEEIRGRRKR